MPSKTEISLELITRPVDAWQTNAYVLICRSSGYSVLIDPGGEPEILRGMLADSRAKVASYTVDRLAYSPNPPLLFGMIEFEEGAKFMMQFANCDPEKVEVGQPMEMIFRIKQYDKERNLRNYFWKASQRNE